MAESYETAGIRGQEEALSAVVRHLGPTLNLPSGARFLTDFGHYASVVKVSDDLAIAISTDGVGSKTIVASALDHYDTIGFDCVAMNVNDIICVGARPIAMVDYLGVHTLDPRRTEEILRGLGAAAKEASIAIPGGELAQLPEVIGSNGDEKAFDLVGTCIGLVAPASLVTGRDIKPGDTLIGIHSSGIHSNGLTLARRVLVERGGYSLTDEVGSLRRTIGEELLHPTEIYVRAITALWDAGVETHGLAHITSDGFANLCRLEAEVGYLIEELPPIPAIFQLIQHIGGVADEEMYRVFNMGVGFVVAIAPESADHAVGIITSAGYRATKIGRATVDGGKVEIKPVGLVGSLADGASRFEQT